MKVRTKAGILAATLALTGGVAIAASTVSGVPASAMNGVKNAVASDGSLKANAVGNHQIKAHSIDKSKLAFGLSLAGPRGAKGKDGATGPAGPAGPQGATGATGATGAASTVPGPVGPKGDKGDQGIPGTAAAKGDKGDTGAQGPRGFTGDTGPAGPQGAASTVAGPKGDKGLTGDTGPQGGVGPKGDNGAPGAAGLNGAKGDKGDPGLQGPGGVQGAKGDTGAPGATGAKGDKGDTGNTGPAGPQGVPGANAPLTDYGIVNVNVSRGGAVATTWAQYTTPLGSPVGGTTGGVFRFTCTTAKAPCTISVQAAVEGQSTSVHHTFYPRLMVYNAGDGNGQGAALVTCEYADGSTGAGNANLTDQGLTPTPTYSAIPLNIGGSDDCGLNGAAGDVAQITVPNGYYDVHSTFAFGPNS